MIRFTLNTLILLSLAISSKSQTDSISLNIDTAKRYHIFYEKHVTWLTGSFFFIGNRRFSVDEGATWRHVGSGSKLKPYLLNSKEALKMIDKYQISRTLGFLQSWIIGPGSFALLINYNENHPSDENSYGYLGMIGLLSFISGQVTYHLIAPHYLNKAININNSDFEKAYRQDNSYLMLKYDYRNKIPMISWTYEF
jgi:hypothetical protein